VQKSQWNARKEDTQRFGLIEARLFALEARQSALEDQAAAHAESRAMSNTDFERWDNVFLGVL